MTEVVNQHMNCYALMLFFLRKMRFFRRCLLVSWVTAGCLVALHAKEVIHHGPVLDIQVQRGEEVLSIFQVNRLKRGDKVLVKPEMNSLAKGDWLLLLARVSPAGHQVAVRRFDLSTFTDYASIDIAADDQVPVLMLAPQLRNLFGLYTSFTESANFLQDLLQSDPQKFYDLQKLDQVNQAISALSQGLEQLMLGRPPEQAISAAKELAFKFGVQNVDAECFKSNVVNTQCVAANIVASKDFVLPSANELGSMVGQKKAADLTGFLTANIHALSQASDFISHQYRDQYDFAPAFGRPKGDSLQTELFSLTRFRSGTIKTAYVYVPAWFSGPVPVLGVREASPACWLQGKLDVQVAGRLPVANYWHDWRLSVIDPETQKKLGRDQQPKFFPERGVFEFDPLLLTTSRWPRSQHVELALSGRFGFDFVDLPRLKMVLPFADNLTQVLRGADQLIAGEKAQLVLGSNQNAACVDGMVLMAGDKVIARSDRAQPNTVPVDLSRVSPGPVRLEVTQWGQSVQSIELRVLNHRAQVKSIEHAELDTTIRIVGEQLDRIGSVRWDDVRCDPQEIQETGEASDELVLTCQGDIRANAKLPQHVMVHHRLDEPGPIKVKLTKRPAPPRMHVASSPQSLLVRPSAKAVQWGLSPHDLFMTDDSGLSVLLQADQGYSLPRGTYTLQLRFADDPRTAKTPVEHPLMVDFNHMELRTRVPVSFKGVDLPSAINPLEFRVVHQPSGSVGRWLPLNRSVLMVPDVKSISCAAVSGAHWVHGTHLDKLDAAEFAAETSPVAQDGDPLAPAELEGCDDGLCLRVTSVPEATHLRLKLHWVDQRIFKVKLPNVPACTP